MNHLKLWFKNHNYDWKYKLKVCLPIISGLIILDWLTKFLVMKLMDYKTPKPFIPKFLRFNYVINLGSAYGNNQDNLALTITLAAIFTTFILVILIFNNNRKWLIGLSFINGGSLGNLVGRAWCPASVKGAEFNTRGGVIDFLEWDFGSANYIFNLADVFVITGGILLALALIWEGIDAIKKMRSYPQSPNSNKENTMIQEQESETN